MFIINMQHSMLNTHILSIDNMKKLFFDPNCTKQKFFDEMNNVILYKTKKIDMFSYIICNYGITFLL